MVARILACVVALLLGSLALGRLFDPATAAANLGMPLLDGIGRSTQVGDLTALFVSGTALCLIGAIRQETPWLYSAALVQSDIKKIEEWAKGIRQDGNRVSRSKWFGFLRIYMSPSFFGLSSACRSGVFFAVARFAGRPGPRFVSMALRRR